MHSDNWAIKAKQMGYRSRAVFKLEEILNKLNHNKLYTNVLDLGSAPGGWSQYIAKKNPKSNIFAIDILEMEPISGVTFVNDIESDPSVAELLVVQSQIVLSLVVP